MMRQKDFLVPNRCPLNRFRNQNNEVNDEAHGDNSQNISLVEYIKGQNQIPITFHETMLKDIGRLRSSALA